MIKPQQIFDAGKSQRLSKPVKTFHIVVSVVKRTHLSTKQQVFAQTAVPRSGIPPLQLLATAWTLVIFLATGLAEVWFFVT